MIKEFRGDHAFLSNFYYQGFIWHGYKYPTAEHAFQSAKVLDPGVQKAIRGAVSPTMAKRVGRNAELRTGWEAIKDGVMLDILFAKFAVPELAQALLDTGTIPLVEGNYWHDNYWGSCYCDKCGVYGRNVLGYSLMTVREVLTDDVQSGRLVLQPTKEDAP